MYSCTVYITIDQFVATDGTITPSDTIQATLAAPIPSNETPQGVFVGNGPDSSPGSTLVVIPPQGYAGAFQINFYLPSTEYTLLGLGFLPNSEGFGLQEFPTITINRTSSGSTLCITDECNSTTPLSFTYGMLVQCVSGPNSGQFGVIDPIIDNDPR